MTEATDDIRIERGDEIRPGVFAWRVPSLSLSGGASRQPHLDACRAIHALCGDTRRYATMFRPGRKEWDTRCPVEWGATHRVRDDDGGMRFVRHDSTEDIAARLNRLRVA